MIEYFVAHMLGDYYFQSQELSDYKDISKIGVLIHSFIYTLSFLLIYILKYLFIFIIDANWFKEYFMNIVIKEFLFVLVIVLVHGLIDWIKYQVVAVETREAKHIQSRETIVQRYINKTRVPLFRDMASGDHVVLAVNGSVEVSPLLIFALDQSLHILTIIFIYHRFFDTFIVAYPVDYQAIQFYLKYLFLLMFIGKPSNIFVTIASARYMPAKTSDDGIQGAGALIGFLERLLVIIFLNFDIYEGIATVYVLKGFARHKKISEDAQFAEYFVLGSFLSMVMIALVLYFYQIIQIT